MSTWPANLTDKIILDPEPIYSIDPFPKPSLFLIRLLQSQDFLWSSVELSFWLRRLENRRRDGNGWPCLRWGRIDAAGELDDGRGPMSFRNVNRKGGNRKLETSRC